MPRKPGKVPSYCRHRASGRAVVRIDGRDRYLGEFGSPASHEEYERCIAEWRAGQRTAVCEQNGKNADNDIRRARYEFKTPASANGLEATPTRQ